MTMGDGGLGWPGPGGRERRRRPERDSEGGAGRRQLSAAVPPHPARLIIGHPRPDHAPGSHLLSVRRLFPPPGRDVAEFGASATGAAPEDVRGGAEVCLSGFRRLNGTGELM